jgi:hypothetical protein
MNTCCRNRYGMEDYTQDMMIEAAQLANAHDFIETFEDGYATRCGERGVRLSGIVCAHFTYSLITFVDSLPVLFNTNE